MVVVVGLAEVDGGGVHAGLDHLGHDLAVGVLVVDRVVLALGEGGGAVLRGDDGRHGLAGVLDMGVLGVLAADGGPGVRLGAVAPTEHDEVKGLGASVLKVVGHVDIDAYAVGAGLGVVGHDLAVLGVGDGGGVLEVGAVGVLALEGDCARVEALALSEVDVELAAEVLLVVVGPEASTLLQELFHNVNLCSGRCPIGVNKVAAAVKEVEPRLTSAST